MEGSVRQAGSQLRVAVQLTDASTGAHLWAETYNRPFQPDAIFDLQDDLVPRIVSTVADRNGALPRSMGDALRGRPAGDLTPYEAVLLGWSFYARITADEHAEIRAALERAVEQAPGNADCWAMLSMLYQDEYRHGFNPRPDPLGRALTGRAACRGPRAFEPFRVRRPRVGPVLPTEISRHSGEPPSGRSRSTRWTPTASPTWAA